MVAGGSGDVVGRRGLVGVLLGWLLGQVQATAAAEPGVSTIVVAATPTNGGVAAAWDVTGTQRTIPWGQPVRMANLASVSVFTRFQWQEGAVAGCSILIDGQLVTVHTATGPDMVAACVWPQ